MIARHFLFSCLGLVTAFCLTGCDDGPPLLPGHCEIETLGRLPLRRVHNIPVIEAKIDNKPVLFMVDTGAFNSVLFKSAIKGLDIAYTGGTVHAVGVHGPEIEPVVRIGKLDLGAGHDTDFLFTLSSSSFEATRPPLPPLVGLLGAEVLLGFDLVIDMPHHEMQLLNMKRCPYVTPLWKGVIHEIPIERDMTTNKINLTFSVDGSKPVPAIFDTGASGIMIPYPVAHWTLGMTRKMLTSDAHSTESKAIGPETVTSYLHIFKKLTLGDFTIDNPRIMIDDTDNIDFALFGSSFLKSTRIWLTTKGKMYVQHVSEMGDAPAGKEPSAHPAPAPAPAQNAITDGARTATP